MPNTGMRAMVPPIPTNPLPHGLLGGCVDVVQTPNLHELNGTDMVSSHCVPAEAWQDCPEPDPITGAFVNPAEKTFTRVDACSFEPVTVEAGIECSAFGLDYDEARARALEALELGEQQVLERFFFQRGLAKYAMGNDLTPAGGAVSLCVGVGTLEAWLAANYGGTGIIHAPVVVGSMLSGNRIVDFTPDGECIRTLIGNGVVLGAGYSPNFGPYTAPLTPGAAPGPGETWLYITPAMRIRRDTRELVQRAEWQTMNTLVNDRKVMAETTFVPEVDCCIAAAIRITTTC